MVLDHRYKMLGLTDDQLQATEKVQESVEDVWQERFEDPEIFIRFMRARSFKTAEVERMIREDWEWRKKHDADNILKLGARGVNDVLADFWPGGFCGDDKYGRPVYVMPIGCVDMCGYVHSVRKEDVIRYTCWFMEDLYRQNAENGRKHRKKITQATFIFDMDKFGISHITYPPAVDCFMDIVMTMEDHYPESAHTFNIINVPKIFSMCYSMLSPFLTDIMASKIKVHGGDWKPELLKIIDPHQIPVHYGGNKTTGPDNDPKCSALIGYSGEIPTSRFLLGTMSVPKEDLTRGFVGMGNSLQLDFKITLPGTIIRWEFMSEDNDIGFGVYQRTPDSADSYQPADKMSEVIATKRFNAHLVPDFGTLCCDKPGTYVLRFDNSYSWMTSKIVFYKVDILKPIENDGDLSKCVQGLVKKCHNNSSMEKNI